MDAPRNRGRGRLLVCFRPAFVAADDDDQESVSYSSSLHPSGDDAAGRSKKNLRRSFCATLKAVLLKSPLLKKSRIEKHHEKGLGEKGLDKLRSKILTKGKSFVKSMTKSMSRKHYLEAGDDSNRSPLFSSSSSRSASTLGSSSSASQRSSPARSEADAIQRAVSLDRHLRRTEASKKTMKRESGRKYCRYKFPTHEMCVLLVCLFALIWGKAFAVVTCTSAWLFFAPGRRGPKLRRGGSLESEEYKKRVIMEGWLERDRTRVLQS